MKVECNICADCKEPHAVLHIAKMTPPVAQAISLLEKEDTDTIAATRDGKTYFISPGNLELVRTEGRDIACYDKLRNRYLLSRPLYELEDILGRQFARVSKSTIINLRRISHVEAGLNGTMELVMKNGVEDYISRKYRKSFKERLGLK